MLLWKSITTSYDDKGWHVTSVVNHHLNLGKALLSIIVMLAVGLGAFYALNVIVAYVTFKMMLGL
jgi:hypothetical protein